MKRNLRKTPATNIFFLLNLYHQMTWRIHMNTRIALQGTSLVFHRSLLIRDNDCALHMTHSYEYCASAHCASAYSYEYTHCASAKAEALQRIHMNTRIALQRIQLCIHMNIRIALQLWHLHHLTHTCVWNDSFIRVTRLVVKWYATSIHDITR